MAQQLPTTWREAYSQLDEQLSIKERRELAKAKDLDDYHFGLGLWIRNHWIHGNLAPFLEKEKDIFFIPDHISEMVMKRYRSALRRRKSI